MSSKTIALVAALTAGGALLAPAVLADDAAVIKYRQAVMKSIGGHMGSLGAIAKGEVPHKAHMVVHARAIETTFSVVEDAFRDKTDGGETTAKPEIWGAFADFTAKIADARTAAAELVSALESGGDVGAAMKGLGSTCGACHKEYRVKK